MVGLCGHRLKATAARYYSRMGHLGYYHSTMQMLLINKCFEPKMMKNIFHCQTSKVKALLYSFLSIKHNTGIYLGNTALTIYRLRTKWNSVFISIIGNKWFECDFPRVLCLGTVKCMIYYKNKTQREKKKFSLWLRHYAY